MDDAIHRYAKAARRMGLEAGIVRVEVVTRERGITGRWVVGIGGSKLWVPEAYALMESPSPKRPASRQTACRRCGLDIEGIAPFPVGGWRDRGNNSRCPNTGFLHEE